MDFTKMLERAQAEAAKREADPEWQAAMRAMEAKRARERAEWPYRASGIAKVLKAVDLEMLIADSAEPTPASKLIDAWVDQALNPEKRSPRWRNWAWVNSAPGRGKTIAAGKAIGRVCPWFDGEDSHKHQRHPRYVLFRDLMDAHKLRSSFDRTERADAQRVIDGAVSGHLVVLDEVGQELEADANLARMALHNFVDMRQASQGLTLVLSNKSAADIDARFRSEWYDQRTESRLKALLSRGPNGEALRDVTGPDLRGDALVPSARVHVEDHGALAPRLRGAR
jgi:hypothetical protein